MITTDIHTESQKRLADELEYGKYPKATKEEAFERARCFVHWLAGFRFAFGKEYPPTHNADGTAICTMYKELGGKELRGMMDRYFKRAAVRDSYSPRAHNLTWFSAHRAEFVADEPKASQGRRYPGTPTLGGSL